MTAGLTPLGFVPKTIAEIITDLQANQRSSISGSLNTSSTGVVANLNMSFATELAQVWELAEEVYDAHDPETAEGVAADHNGSLTGVPRLPATKAQVVLLLTATGNSIVPTGSVVSNPLMPTVRFVTLEDLTTAVGAPTADYSIRAEAETAGQLTAAPNTLSKIESPASGWLAVTNLNAAIPGRNVETDEQYRLRQLEVRDTTEGGTLAGIVADVRLLPNVVTVTGYENVLDVPVGGMPGHSFEIVVSGGADAVIAASIWGNKPAGIETFGTTSVNVIDTEGVVHAVRFSRPVQKIINVNYAATTGYNYVTGGIRAALETAAVDPLSPAHFTIGQPIYLVRMLAIASEVVGVVNVTLDADAAPTLPADAIPSSPDKTIPMGPREVGTFVGANWVPP